MRWYGTSTDIHDRKLADEALRASENNPREILDSIPGLVCTMDPTGEIQHLNRPLLDYFGKTPEELKGWKMTDAVHPDDYPDFAETVGEAIRRGDAPQGILICGSGVGVGVAANKITGFVPASATTPTLPIRAWNTMI